MGGLLPRLRAGPGLSGLCRGGEGGPEKLAPGALSADGVLGGLREEMRQGGAGHRGCWASAGGPFWAVCTPPWTGGRCPGGASPVEATLGAEGGPLASGGASGHGTRQARPHPHPSPLPLQEGPRLPGG